TGWSSNPSSPSSHSCDVRGQWARQVSRPSADRLPEQFAIFAQFIFLFYVSDRAVTSRHGFNRAETSA
ncbi:MAG TPA: hypothetical protein VGH17_08320, partial [Candidatus Acidoferrales bacterium]